MALINASRYVSYHEKLYRCSPNYKAGHVSFKSINFVLNIYQLACLGHQLRIGNCMNASAFRDLFIFLFFYFFFSFLFHLLVQKTCLYLP